MKHMISSLFGLVWGLFLAFPLFSFGQDTLKIVPGFEPGKEYCYNVTYLKEIVKNKECVSGCSDTITYNLLLKMDIKNDRLYSIYLNEKRHNQEAYNNNPVAKKALNINHGFEVLLFIDNNYRFSHFENEKIVVEHLRNSFEKILTETRKSNGVPESKESKKIDFQINESHLSQLYIPLEDLLVVFNKIEECNSSKGFANLFCNYKTKADSSSIELNVNNDLISGKIYTKIYKEMSAEEEKSIILIMSKDNKNISKEDIEIFKKEYLSGFPVKSQEISFIYNKTTSILESVIIKKSEQVPYGGLKSEPNSLEVTSVETIFYKLKAGK